MLARLRVLSGKETCEILEKNGFSEVRRHGSHIVMQMKTSNTTITVPIPNHKTLKRGTLSSIIRQSGINRNEFES